MNCSSCKNYNPNPNREMLEFIRKLSFEVLDYKSKQQDTESDLHALTREVRRLADTVAELKGRC